MFEVRKYQSSDHTALIKAWLEAYPDLFHLKYPSRWLWNMLQNPFVPEEARPLCWVAAIDDEIAAWSCAMAVPITAAGEQVVGGHSVDTFTLTRYRRYGLGKQLQELNQASHTIFLSIDPSAGNRRIKLSIGGLPGKPLYTMLRVGSTLDSDILYNSFLRLIRKYLGQRIASSLESLRRVGLSRLITVMCNAGLRYRQNIQHHTTSPRLTFTSVDFFDSRSDYLWERVARNFSFAISRYSTYLNWKYVSQPDMNYFKFMAFSDSEPVGVLVFRLPATAEQRAGIVSECFCINDDHSTYVAMLTHAIQTFEQAGIDLIKCGASTKNQQKALKDLGFSLVDIDVPVFHVSSFANLTPESFMEKDWLLSLGDQDMDQVRPEQQPTFVELLRVFCNRIPGMEHTHK